MDSFRKELVDLVVKYLDLGRDEAEKIADELAYAIIERAERHTAGGNAYGCVIRGSST